jgi:hypothetical protein
VRTIAQGMVVVLMENVSVIQDFQALIALKGNALLIVAVMENA